MLTRIQKYRLGRWVRNRLWLPAALPLFILFSLVHVSVIAQLRWPTVTQTARPWTRWWWQGSAVNEKDLSRNLQQYQQAGLGGVEITPIYGVHGFEHQFIPYLSTRWMKMLVHTLRESRRLGLGVDLANATGWPFGGPWVSDEDASKTIYCKIFQVPGGGRLAEPVEYYREGWARQAAGQLLSTDSIRQPLAANRDLQSLAIDQVQFPGKLPLKLVMAYGEGYPPVDLTKLVGADGRLNWTAPGGLWTVYALFEGLHGKLVERAAPGGEGYAIDHFSARAARNYFKKFDRAFQGNDLHYLRGFFNDSYEVDDAKEQANWTPGFLEEFSRRKGYDLRNYLPELFGRGDSMAVSKVIYDYRSTIDELILDHFTREWKKWGQSKHKLLRNQSHGSPANTLDLYSVVDIPETEGDDILRFKFATSAANVTGKKLVSAEAATWLDEHFRSSWGEVKKAADLYFLGGVNHIFYHGTAYSPAAAPWPGWLFYASVHFQPVDPQWKDFHALNGYITRTQSFLQQSRPANDLLVYYPLADRYAEHGKNLLQHFDGMERNFEKTSFDTLSRWLLQQGIGFDFFSDRQLAGFVCSNGMIRTGGSDYRAILLPANRLIPLSTMQRLLALAKAGARILFYRQLPEALPGVVSMRAEQQFGDLLRQLQFAGDTKLREARIGTGRLVAADDPALLIQVAGIRAEPGARQGLSILRRRNKNGCLYFINNRSDQPFEGWVELLQAAADMAVYDPMTGQSGLGLTRSTTKKGHEIFLQLPPWGSWVVQPYKGPQTHARFPYYQPSGNSQPLSGEWKLSFLSGGPVLPPVQHLTNPVCWTELAGDEVKRFSGTAAYTLDFSRPAQQAERWLLDLGRVYATAEVVLNGKIISTLIGPSFQVLIPDSQLRSSNHLEVRVSNLMANRIADMDRRDIPWKVFYNINMPARKKENSRDGLFNARDWNPLPSGLAGPVMLTPLRQLMVSSGDNPGSNRQF